MRGGYRQTSVLEIALTGIPLVLVGRETDFDQNPVAWFSEMDKPVYSPEELRIQVIQKLAISPADHEILRDWARRMRHECVSPVSEAAVSAFVRPR